jgi:hypothetical protein
MLRRSISLRLGRPVAQKWDAALQQNVLDVVPGLGPQDKRPSAGLDQRGHA